MVLTNNDSAYATALDLYAAKVGVTVVDIRPEPSGALPARARADGIRVLAGHAITATRGHRQVREVEVRRFA